MNSSPWVTGYLAALADLELIAFHRKLGRDVCIAVADLRQDARVIDHELANREQKRRYSAAREAVLPLFKDETLG